MTTSRAAPFKRLLTILRDPVGTLTAVRDSPNVVAPWSLAVLAGLVSGVVAWPFAVQRLEQALPGGPAPGFVFTYVLWGSFLALVGPLVAWSVWAGLLRLTVSRRPDAAPFRRHLAMVAYASVPATLGSIILAPLLLVFPPHLRSPLEGLGAWLYSTLIYNLPSLPFALWTLGLTVVGYALINRVSRGRAALAVVGLSVAGFILSLVLSVGFARGLGVPW